MNEQVIPVEAVEAAAKIHYEHHLLIWEDAHPLSRAKVLDEMRAALEAAAPYMQAADEPATDEQIAEIARLQSEVLEAWATLNKTLQAAAERGGE